MMTIPTFYQTNKRLKNDVPNVSNTHVTFVVAAIALSFHLSSLALRSSSLAEVSCTLSEGHRARSLGMR